VRQRVGTAVRLSAACCALTVALLASAGCSPGSSTANQATGGGRAAESGTPGGSAATVTMTEKIGPPDSYSFAPATITVKGGENLSVVNKTDEDHELSCTPDPGIKAESLMVPKAGGQVLAFGRAGTYACASRQHPEAKLTVTVG
jgi:plastocyanin